jgi:hypothetical protein
LGFLFILSFTVSNIDAHPGNTASDGCHFCRTNCGEWGYTYDTRHGHQGQTCDPSKGSIDPLYSRVKVITTPVPTTPSPTITPTPTLTLVTPTSTPTVSPTVSLTPTSQLQQEVKELRERLNKTEEKQEQQETRISWLESSVNSLLDWIKYFI